MTTPASRSARVAARAQGMTTVRRVTIAMALSAAGAIAGVTGMIATSSEATPTAVTESSPSSTSAASSTPSASSSTPSGSDDDWGTSTAPEESSGDSADTSSGGS